MPDRWFQTAGGRLQRNVNYADAGDHGSCLRGKSPSGHQNQYGRIRDIEVKTPNRPPAFAFVSFENYHDAEDAIRGRG
eukprot:746504-Hanusia_phi.AAC.2